MSGAAERRLRQRVMLIHAVPEAVAPIREAFAAGWPEAEIHDLLDSSLSADLAADGGALGARMIERFRTLGRYAAGAGPDGRASDAILFTCSAFGPAIEAVRGSSPFRSSSPTRRPSSARSRRARGSACS